MKKTQYESFKIADQGKDLFHIRENGTMRQCTLIHFMIHEAKWFSNPKGCPGDRNRANKNGQQIPERKSMNHG